jgi:Ribbon-helix-helix protein, copG family
MLVRKQIVVPRDVDARIRRMAARKGTSQSAVIVEAVRALPDERTQIDQMMDFAGVVTGAPRRLSEEVDSVLYG